LEISEIYKPCGCMEKVLNIMPIFAASMDKEKTKGTSRIAIFAVIVIFLMLVSFFAFSKIRPNGPIEDSYTYNNFEFQKVSGLWVTEVFNPQTKTVYNLPLHYGPKELENVEYDENAMNFLNLAGYFKTNTGKSGCYVTFNPDINDSQITLAYYELSRHMGQALNIETFPTVTHDVDNIENETIKNCETNNQEPIIYLKYESPAKVEMQRNCLVIQGEGSEMVMAANRALYGFYNIMK
jgi:hypothetical protein